jgi:hypothetical protein
MAFGEGAATGAQVGSLAGGAGGPIGAAVGLGFDIFALVAQRKQAKKDFKTFKEFQFAEMRLNQASLTNQLFEERLNALQSMSDLTEAAEISIGAGQQSALESGVSGNSLKAVSATKRLQTERVRGRIVERLKRLDVNFKLQNDALRLSVHSALTSAAMQLERSLPSPFELIGGAAKGGLSVYDTLSTTK